MELRLVANRECGPCNACCTQPAIIDPALDKPPNLLCHHWQTGSGCSIYETRPVTCRGHYCAWRLFSRFDDSWRPDLSNIYIEAKGDPPEHFRDVMPSAEFALRFTLIGTVTPHKMGQLLTAITELVGIDLPVILAVSAPPGHLGCHMLLNPLLKPLVENPGPLFLQTFAQALHTLLEMPPEKAD